MANLERALQHAVEFLPDRLYYLALNGTPSNSSNKSRHFFSIDNEMIYWNFYLDYGPLHLGHHPHKRTNAAFLICAWALLCLNKSPEDAFKPFRQYHLSFPPWHDATPTACHFNLTILHTLQGLYKAREFKFFDFDNFNLEEYEYFEQVENGDLNWVMDKRFIAFAGPHAQRQASPGGYYNLTPEDYIPYFKKKNVNLVVRLNKAYYDSKKFTSQGINHMELYFLDGSNPSDAILNKFITRCEETSGAIAVHCKAGLGRTGCCIGAYMMKHFKLTAEELIGWLRIVRPGSIIGPQQQFMKDIQMKMWREGDLMRSRIHQLPTLNSSNNSGGSNKDKSPRSNANSGYPPMSPQSQSNLLTRRMNKLSVTSPTAAAGSASLLSPSSTGSRSGSTPGNGVSPLKAALSPTDSVSSDPVIGSGTPTQGDYLRMRRQQGAGGGRKTITPQPTSPVGDSGTPKSSGRKGFSNFLSFNK